MSTLASIVAYAVAEFAPGWAAVRWLGLGRNGLERFVLAAALGRLLLAAATLLTTASVGGSAMLWWPPLACAVAAAGEWRARRASPVRGDAPGAPARAWLPVAAAGIGLVYAIVGRSGTTLESGALRFLGRDASFDPLVYLSVARRLAEVGPPLTHPLIGGVEASGSYIPFAALAGLHLATKVAWLDLAFRAVPMANVVGVGLAGVSLGHAIGFPVRAAALAGALLLLASGADLFLTPGTSGEGPFAFFGPYLLPFNPIGPALQTWLAACLLLATRSGSVRSSVLAGILLASLFEIKVFLWLPVVLALGAASLGSRGAPGWRRATWAAAAASLPLVAAKLWTAAQLADSYETGLRLCVGCIPRYLAAELWNPGTGFSGFRDFQNLDILSPALLGQTLLATGVVGALAIGGRGLGAPELWARARRGDPVARHIGAAAAFGLILAATLTIGPHYLNGAQFAFPATFGLALFTAFAAVRGWSEGRKVVVAVCLLLTIAGSLRVVFGPLGFRAPTSLVITAGESELVGRLRELAAPRDVVLEPSALEDESRPSPVAWFAGRPVYLSGRSAGVLLPAGEMERRLDVLARAFTPGTADDVRAAIDESGADWIYSPAHRPLGHPMPPGVKRFARSAAGTLYRVDPAPENR